MQQLCSTIKYSFFLLLLTSLACQEAAETSILTPPNDSSSNLQNNDNPFIDISHAPIRYYVVSLSESTERRAAISAQFDANNSVINFVNQVNKSIKQENISFGFIDAILGRMLDKNSLISEGYYQPNSLKDGELGLFRTTTEFILPIAQNKSPETLSVMFEDDVILAADLDFSFRQALKLVPKDWDILYLGCFQNTRVGANFIVLSPFTPPQVALDSGDGTNLCPDSSTERVPGTSWVKLKEWCTPGTWAYTLNSKSAQKISLRLREMQPIDKPIDEAYRVLARDRKLNIYCLNPELVRPNYALPSTIR